MTLSEKQRKHLRTLGHALKPVVMIGAKGLTESVLQELDQSIEHHELMKIRISVGDRDVRDAIIAEVRERSGAELVQRIGNIALLFRPRKKNSAIKLP
jgi:RNA-binding protein